MDLTHLRQDYQKDILDEKNIATNPIDQFRHWFSQAQNAQILEPNAMIISTVDATNQPSSRVVLLKEVLNDNFVFYTNYNSKKGDELAQNPKISILFFWGELQRQVRIEGEVRKVANEISEKYFYSRPIDSQIGAILSNQSHKINSRAELEDAFKNFDKSTIIRPLHWGGYEVIPTYFEFWQGRSNRLHDRICYKKENQSLWITERLAP